MAAGMQPTSGPAGGGPRRSTETKHALKTTEFWSFLLVAIAIVIAGDHIGADHGHDYFAADKVWLYVTILTVGYLVSRGLAKAGSRESYTAVTDGQGGGLGDRVAKAAAVLREGDLPEGGDSTSPGTSSRGYPLR